MDCECNTLRLVVAQRRTTVLIFHLFKALTFVRPLNRFRSSS